MGNWFWRRQKSDGNKADEAGRQEIKRFLQDAIPAVDDITVGEVIKHVKYAQFAEHEKERFANIINSPEVHLE